MSERDPRSDPNRFCRHDQLIGANGGVAEADAKSWEDIGMGNVICEFYSACDCCDTLMHKSCCGLSYFVMVDGRTLCEQCTEGEPLDAFDGALPPWAVDLQEQAQPVPLCDVYHSVMHSHPVRCRLPLDHQQEQHEAMVDGKVLRWP